MLHRKLGPFTAGSLTLNRIHLLALFLEHLQYLPCLFVVKIQRLESIFCRLFLDTFFGWHVTDRIVGLVRPIVVMHGDDMPVKPFVRRFVIVTNALVLDKAVSFARVESILCRLFLNTFVI